MADTALTLKIAVLKMLGLSENRLRNHELTDFFTENSICDYWEIQDAISSLSESGMISAFPEGSETVYTLSGEGRKTLEVMSERLSPEMVSGISAYLKENNIDVRQDRIVTSEVIPSLNGSCFVKLKLTENGSDIIDFSMRVPKKEIAELICFNWKSHYEAAVAAVYDSLTT